MAKKPYKYKPVTTNTDDNSMERSIAYFNKNVTNFSSSTDKLVKSIDTFTKSVDAFKKSTEEDKKTKEKDKKDRDKDKKSGGSSPDAPASKNQAWAKKTQKGLDKFQTQASKLGIERLQKFTGDVFGKKASQTMTRGMAKFAGAIGPKGGGGFGAGMMGKAMGGLGSIAGGVLRAAGPIGAIAGVAKMAFDFWDSGGFAKMKVGLKMLGGNKMNKASDLEDVKSSLEGTEQMRKLNAEYNYAVPLQLKQQAADDMLQYNKGIEQDSLNYSQGLVKDKLEYEMGLRKDAMQFQFQQAMETLDAEMSKRKDIQASGMSFINQYSTISERALRAIGSSTKMIVEGISKFQQIFGGSVKESFELSENAQGLAYHFGVGADDVQNMTNLFRLMGKTTAKTAQNLINGITAFADLNKLSPQAIFAQIKDAGEDIYKFSSGTAENFVKQAGLLTKMSVSMSQMMKASDSMVLNYKDSIKAEMSLSAMLGKNVNLSEVRARLMSGDQAGAASALKTALGGIDVGAMNAFQKQALTQATGMDISALMGLQQGKGGGLSGELKAEQNKGKAFADGALNQDIANASAKMKLEQEQRAKMLAFEQRQRLIMLTLEQAQRMDGIALEQKYRALIAAKGYEDAKNTMAMEMIKDQASKFSSNMTAGTASGLDRQGLSDAAIGDFTKTISGVDSGLSTLISSGAVKGTDMRLANYLSAKDDILQTAGAKDKKGNLVNTPEMIAQKLSDAMTKSFGGEIKQYNEAVTKKTSETNAQIAAFQAIVNAQNVIDSGKDRGSATSAQVKALETAAEFAKKQYPELFKEFEKSKGQGNVKNWQRGNNAEFINGLKQTIPKPLDGKGTAAATAEGNKLVVNAANVQTVKQGEIIVQQKTMLTNAEYEFKLQQEMVALLGLSSQILNRIMENTKGEKGSITLYGRSLTQSLLNEARRNYAISRTE
jgi:hypothetical protein